MELSRKKNIILLLILLSALVLGFSFIFIRNYKMASVSEPVKSEPVKVTENLEVNKSDIKDVSLPLANPPEIIKAVYVTGWSAGSRRYLNYLQSLFKTTQINAVVIDVKDNFGSVSYKTEAQKAKKYKAYYPQIPDIDALVKELHGYGIYVIGRMVVFEDSILAKNRPDLAVYDASNIPVNSNIQSQAAAQYSAKPAIWKDNHGLSWVDPASPEVWDYNIEIARDAISHGFDEINFDYVRFPTDGKLESIGFPIWDKKVPRHLVIKNFFQKLRNSLPDTKISADLFGQTAINTDDMGIGQILEDSFNYFDYVCPMVYPSHYANGFLGFTNPANNPYEIIKYSMDSALARENAFNALQEASNKSENDIHPSPSAKTAEDKIPIAEPSKTSNKVRTKIRPWLQDFNLGAIYNAGMVKKEIQAVIDTTGENFSGYLLWNPSNIYTKEAIAPDKAEPK